MRGTLRIFRTDTFMPAVAAQVINATWSEAETLHVLVSDGIMFDPRTIIPADRMEKVMVQRILTSYQLEKILMDSDNFPFYICVSSSTISSWKLQSIEAINEIMRIKSYYHGCRITFHIVGPPGLFNVHLNAAYIAPPQASLGSSNLYDYGDGG
ncbi:MAG TPA: hypothetical protein VKU79_06475 [Thermoplasmataceae archaeon]|nr:hypothetical protein [Thermoplasmatales archaeon AK]HLH86487.1 hypothetical protein [Thermoplasmataceae archaeon]